MRCPASWWSGSVSSAAAISMKVACCRVIEPSPGRVEPRCAHFGMCGGCVLQHLSGEQQLQFKQKQLMDSLTRIGKVTPQETLPALQAASWNYRRRGASPRRAGCRRRVARSWAFVSAARRTSRISRRCEVLQAPLDQLIVPLSELVTALSIRNRVPQIEVARRRQRGRAGGARARTVDGGRSGAAAPLRSRAFGADVPAARRL